MPGVPSSSSSAGLPSGGPDGKTTPGAGSGGEQPRGSSTDDITTAQQVFKKAKEQRSSTSDDPWATGDWADGDSGWVAGGGQSGDSDLEGEFEKSLEDYDGKIMDERAIIIARANERAGERDLPEAPQGPVGSGGPGSESGGPEGVPGSAGSPTASGTSDIPTNLPPKNTTPGDYRPQQVARVPVDVPSGDDDDVVARQLREAAMNEEDPELRDKLWDEYRKYKNAIQ